MLINKYYLLFRPILPTKLPFDRIHLGRCVGPGILRCKSTTNSLRSTALKTLPRLCSSESSYISSRSLTVNGLSMKPPNILVVTDREVCFDQYKEILTTVLQDDAYTIYPLVTSKIKSAPWFDNCPFLVLHSEADVSENDVSKIQMFVKDGGKVLSLRPISSSIKGGHYKSDVMFPHNNSESFNAVLHEWKAQESDKASSPPDVDLSLLHLNEKPTVLVQEKQNANAVVWSDCGDNVIYSRLDILSLYKTDRNSGNKNVLSLIKRILKYFKLHIKDDKDGAELEQEKQNVITHAVMHGEERNIKRCLESFQETLEENVLKGNPLTIGFTRKGDLNGWKASEEFLPVLICSHSPSFDFKVFDSNLNTKEIGKVLLFADVVQSTQDIFEKNHQFNMNCPNGVVVVARQQTKGQGRGRNVWLSPVGCLMFSLAVTIPIQSRLGQKLPFLQHIAAVAVASAVRNCCDSKDIPVRLKWPNDIYSGSETKIGGIVVKSTCFKDTFRAVLGVGVNLSNEKPTVCINQMIEDYNSQHGTNISSIKMEVLLATILSQLEELIELFQDEGADAFCRHYYKYWNHQDQRVRIESEDGEEVTICGLDEYGFLLVKQENGTLISLQPDGNTFDMMRNLIRSK